jgi:pimeloyl-ACP methyl ester carboxylesterase
LPLRNLNIKDVVDHYDRIIRGLDRPPIIIGHSFGGLFTQLLADRGLGATAVALGTGAPKGVLRLPYSTIRAAWPALGNPTNLRKEAPLTAKQFHWCFTNVLSREESDAVYKHYYIPGSARPFFQAGYANFNPTAVTKVDYRNP